MLASGQRSYLPITDVVRVRFATMRGIRRSTLRRGRARSPALVVGWLVVAAAIGACGDDVDVPVTAPAEAPASTAEQPGDDPPVAASINPLWDPAPGSDVGRAGRAAPPANYVRELDDGSTVLTWNGVVREGRSFNVYRSCPGEDAWTLVTVVPADTMEHRLAIDRPDCTHGVSTTSEFGDEGDVAEAVVAP